MASIQTSSKLKRFVAVAIASVHFASAPASAEKRPDDSKSAYAEGIVAIVDGDPILWSELRARLRPVLQRQPPEQRAIVYPKLVRELTTKLIRDRLVERECDRKDIAVTDEETTRALDAVAAQNGLSIDALFLEVGRHGMNEKQYREEIRLQIRRGKLLQIYASELARRTAVATSDWSLLEEQMCKELEENSIIEDRLRP